MVMRLSELQTQLILQAKTLDHQELMSTEAFEQHVLGQLWVVMLIELEQDCRFGRVGYC